MPAPKSPSDEDFERFDFRPKVGKFPRWIGCSKDGDEGSGPTNQTAEALNVRSDGEGYICRGGLTKAITNTATSDLDGIWEAGDPGAADAAVIDLSGTPYSPMYLLGSKGETGAYTLIHVDTDTGVIDLPLGVNETTAEGVPGAVDYSGGQYALVAGSGSLTGRVISLPAGTTLFTLPVTGVGCKIHTMLAVGTDLYISWTDVISGSSVKHTISRWNGSALSLELEVSDTEGNGWWFNLGALGTTPYAALRENTNTGIELMYKRTGVATWTTMAVPGGGIYKAKQLQEYDGRLYFIGTDDATIDGEDDQVLIYSTDGSSVTLDRSIAIAPSSFIPYVGLGVVGTDLYYWYQDGQDGSSYNMVGKFDGATWDDAVVDLQVYITTYSHSGPGAFVCSVYGANLVVIVNATNNIQIWESPGTDIAGIWTLALEIENDGINHFGTLSVAKMAV